MTPEEIRAAIAASPEIQALGQNTQAIADAMSVGRTRTEPRMTSARGLAELMPGGPLAAEVVLLKLEGARDALLASADPSEKVMGSLLRRQLGFLSGEGLDFGSAALRGMIQQFGQLGILAAEDVAGLLTIGVVPDPVSEFDVRKACWADDGTWRA